MLMPTVESLCVFQVAILAVPVEVTLQIQSQSNYTLCIICSSFTLIQCDGEQMQYAYCDRWFPVLKGPCEIASPSHFQMFIESFNWIRFWKHRLNVILFCYLWLCFSNLHENGLLSPLWSERRPFLPRTRMRWHPIQAVFENFCSQTGYIWSRNL